MSKSIVLILCTGNSCRSHIAEGILRHAGGDFFEVRSAGSEAVGYVHPMAITVMKEIGIDISAHESKSLELFLEESIDSVVTVCGNAKNVCPIFPGDVKRYHWGFIDPAHAEGNDEEVMAVFREVRDLIRNTFEAYAAGYRMAFSKSS